MKLKAVFHRLCVHKHCFLKDSDSKSIVGYRYVDRSHTLPKKAQLCFYRAILVSYSCDCVVNDDDSVDKTHKDTSILKLANIYTC